VGKVTHLTSQIALVNRN